MMSSSSPYTLTWSRCRVEDADPSAAGMGIGLDRVPAGAKEYASEFVRAPPSGPASGSVLRLWSSDRGISFRLPSSIGELDAFILNVVWLYASPTDVASLRASVIALVDHMPFLAGRRSTAVVGGARVPVVTLEGAVGVRFSHRAGAPGSAKTYAGDEHVEPERGLLADMATLRGVRRMSEPLFTVRASARCAGGPHAHLAPRALF